MNEPIGCALCGGIDHNADECKRFAGELWAVHAQCPDDIYPAFDRADAERHAAELNAIQTPAGISVAAVVIQSPMSPLEHWKELAEQEREHKAQVIARAAQSAPAGERETIRAVFLRNGFTVKEGQTDLKPYVYAAAEELLRIARASQQRTQSAGAPEGWRDQLLREYPNSDPSYWPDSLIVNAQSREIEELRALLAAAAQPAAQGQGEVQRLREALNWLRGAINCTAENDVDQCGAWISTKHPMIQRIDELLAASTGQEVKP